MPRRRRLFGWFLTNLRAIHGFGLGANHHVTSDVGYCNDMRCAKYYPRLQYSLVYELMWRHPVSILSPNGSLLVVGKDWTEINFTIMGNAWRQYASKLTLQVFLSTLLVRYLAAGYNLKLVSSRSHKLILGIWVFYCCIVLY